MLLSNGRLARLLIVGAVVAGVPVAYVLATGSSAATQEASAFCKEWVLHDYLKPLKRMPKARSAPANGRIGFGPQEIDLEQSGPLVVASEGNVGYKLALRGEARAVHPRWDVTATLSRVDRQGRVIERTARIRRRIPRLTRNRSAGVNFEVSEDPATYRADLVFRNWSGLTLGSFRFYYRVVPRTVRAHLGLNAPSFEPGETVLGRIENLGTTWLDYGKSLKIQQLDGGTWTTVQRSPAPSRRWLDWAWPGESSRRCLEFHIPTTMEPGRYRMEAEAIHRAPSHHPPGIRVKAPATARNLTAEFEVTPG